MIDRTAGDDNFVVLRDFPTGGTASYMVPVDQVSPLAPLAVAQSFTLPEWGSYDNGIPVIFSSAFLNAFDVPTSVGVPVDLSGNALLKITGIPLS